MASWSLSGHVMLHSSSCSCEFALPENGNITTIINPDAWDGNTEKNYTYDNKNTQFAPGKLTEREQTGQHIKVKKA